MKILMNKHLDAMPLRPESQLLEEKEPEERGAGVTSSGGCKSLAVPRPWGMFLPAGEVEEQWSRGLQPRPWGPPFRLVCRTFAGDSGQPRVGLLLPEGSVPWVTLQCWRP